jgi:hypothetical protein
LNHQLVYNLTPKEISILYRVHRTTASKWIRQIHAKLGLEVRKQLKKRLNLNSMEYESIARNIISQFDASLKSALVKDEQSTE